MIRPTQLTIDRFKQICNNEQETSDDEVTYKLLRAFNLGKKVEDRNVARYVVAFGTLRLEVLHGDIVDIWRSKHSYRISKSKKRRYNLEHSYTI